jgi:hypothetical protein
LPNQCWQADVHCHVASGCVEILKIDHSRLVTASLARTISGPTSPTAETPASTAG